MYDTRVRDAAPEAREAPCWPASTIVNLNVKAKT